MVVTLDPRVPASCLALAPSRVQTPRAGEHAGSAAATVLPMKDLRRPIRLPEKASTDRADLDALLDTTRVGHFAARRRGRHTGGDPDDGGARRRPGPGARLDGLALDAPARVRGADGARVTAYDGLVVARSAFESSIRYRSAVVFGRCTPVTEDKERFLDLVTEALIPGRSVEVRRPTKAELAATLVLGAAARRLVAEDLGRLAGGRGRRRRRARPGPASYPCTQSYDAPLAAPDLRDGIDVPPSVRALADRRTASPAAAPGSWLRLSTAPPGSVTIACVNAGGASYGPGEHGTTDGVGRPRHRARRRRSRSPRPMPGRCPAAPGASPPPRHAGPAATPRRRRIPAAGTSSPARTASVSHPKTAP